MPKTMNDSARKLAPMRAVALLAVTVALGLGAAACGGDLLSVEDPENLTPGALDDPAQLPGQVNGAIAEFQEAYVGIGNNNIDRLLSTSALLADEFISTGSFTTRTATDARRQFAPQQGNTSDASVLGLHQARRQAREVADFISENVASDDPRIAEMRALQGYTYIAFGENFCSPQPFSDASNRGPGEFGQPLSTQEIFQRAVEIFDQALAANPDAFTAAVGKGRALVNMGQYQAAASAVSGVPTSFTSFINHSQNSTREQNPLFDLQDVGRFSVANREGQGAAGIGATTGSGLDFLAARDPRIPWVQEADGSFLPGFDFFWQLRYPTRGSDFLLADGVEARLIEAEAALNAGDISGWLDILNELRANVESLMAARFDPPSAHPNFMAPDNPTAGNELEPLEDPGTEEERVDLMFRERAFWLFVSNHRLGDMRRLIRQYGRSPDDVFPSGDYHKQGSYGSDVTLPADFDETNNPNFDVGSCDVSSA